MHSPAGREVTDLRTWKPAQHASPQYIELDDPGPEPPDDDMQPELPVVPDGNDSVAGEDDAPDSWSPVDLATFLDGSHMPAVPGLLHRTDGVGLLYPGLVHWCHGESESGKSWVAQITAARVMLAGDRVLYLDHESDPAEVVGRFLALGVPTDVIAARLAYVRPDVSALAARAAFGRLLAARYTLAVVDGVTDALGLDQASTTDTDEVAGWVRRMPRAIARRTGAAVICVDHVVKSSEGRGRFAIGAQSKMSGVDGAAYMVEIDRPLGRGMVGEIVLRVAKDRPGSVRPHGGKYRASDRTQEIARVVLDATDPTAIEVTVKPPTTAADGTPATDSTFRPTVLMERVSRHLEVHPGITSNAITSAVTGKKTGLTAALAVLVAEGFVATAEDTTSRRGGKLHTTVTAYREDTDPLDERGTRSCPGTVS